MKPLSDIISKPLILAALAPENPSEQKQNLMTLYELKMIDGAELEKLIKVMELKHE